MDNLTALKQDIKRLLVESLSLKIAAEEIGEGQPLFAPGGLGLDSVDALIVAVALERQFRIHIADHEAACQILQSVTSMAEAVAKQRTESLAGPAGRASALS